MIRILLLLLLSLVEFSLPNRSATVCQTQSAPTDAVNRSDQGVVSADWMSAVSVRQATGIGL